MIFHDVAAQTPEWEKLRIGIATASCFDQIVTPKKLELSKSASGYAYQLIAERILNQKLDKLPKTYWMERGLEMESQALRMFQFMNDGLEINRGGFFTNDAGTHGASPDLRMIRGGRIIGGAEIKCPAPWTHVENLLRETVDPAYKLQVQGQIMVGELEIHQWFSFHPDMPPAVITTERDDQVCAALEDGLAKFDVLLKDRLEKLVRKGIVMYSQSNKPTLVPGASLEDFLAAG